MLSANDGTVVDLKSSNRSRGELLFCIAAVLFLVSLASISWSFSLHSKESSLDQHFDGAEDDFQSVSSVIYAKNILADAAATAPFPCPPNSQLPPGRSFPNPRCPKPAHFPAHSSCLTALHRAIVHRAEDCVCSAGFYGPGDACRECPAGSYCPLLHNFKPVAGGCGGGRYYPAGSQNSSSELCPAGYTCAGGSRDKVPCTIPGTYCPPGSKKALYCEGGRGGGGNWGELSQWRAIGASRGVRQAHRREGAGKRSWRRRQEGGGREMREGGGEVGKEHAGREGDKGDGTTRAERLQRKAFSGGPPPPHPPPPISPVPR